MTVAGGGVAVARWTGGRRRVVVVALAILFALSAFAWSRVTSQRPPPDKYLDSRTYYGLAEQLITNGTYAERFPKEEPFRAYRPPGYPLFLALVLELGGSKSTMIDLQVAMQAVVGLLLFFLYLTVTGSALGAYALLVLVLACPALESNSLQLFSEPLYALILYAALLVLVLAWKRRDRRGFAAGGALLGLTALTRTVTLPWVLLGAGLILPLFALAEVVVRLPEAGSIRRRLGALASRRLVGLEMAALTIGCALLVIGPWTVRNYLVLDHLVVVNTANGMNLYFGTREELDWYQEHKRLVNPLRARYGEVGTDRRLIALGLQSYRDRPLLQAKLRARSIRDHFFADMWSMGAKGADATTRLFDRGTHVLLVLGALLALVDARRKRAPELAALLVAFVLLLFSTSLAFHNARFGVPLFPLLLFFVVYGARGLIAGIVGGWRSLRSRARPATVSRGEAPKMTASEASLTLGTSTRSTSSCHISCPL